MNVDAQPAQPPKRRRIYNLNNEEVSSGGLAKPTLNAAVNQRMRLLVLHLHEVFAFLFEFDEEGLLKIDETMKLTSAIWTCYTLKKQEVNTTGSVKTKVNDTTEVTINGITKKIGELKGHFTTICDGYGLQFIQTQPMKDLRGTFQVNLCLIYAFRFRCNEGVYLNNVYKRGEMNGVDKVTKVSSWGVKPAHYSLTYGSNFPPSMQSALMQQLGAAALLIALCETIITDYQQKWVNAVCAQLAGIPNIESIAHLLKGSRDKYIDLVTRVLDIACFGIARQAHKAAFTWNMLRALHAQNAAYVAWTKTIKYKTVEGRTMLDYGAFLDEKTVDKHALEMDWSGKRMWRIYNRIAAIEFQLLMVPGANVDVYAQWLTYSATGVWGEDVAILKTMFDKVPIIRSNYGDAFNARRTKGKYQKVNLYSAVMVCKLASAAQTTLGAVDQYIGVRSAAVSGKAYSKWDADDRREGLLEVGEGGMRGIISGTNRLIDALSAHKVKMLSEIRKKGGIQYGTTSWYKVDDTSTYENYGTEVDTVVNLENVFIFGHV